ncbi:MAG: hypothetical protein PHW10_03165 [Candidatus Peribacteraceae bacterium]|nr:hypothetical protein [Candidatus Peribacteraceae bacterium]
MKLGFSAYNVGPFKMLRQIANEAAWYGHDTTLTSLRPDGEEQLEDALNRSAERLRSCDAVILGVSNAVDAETAVARRLHEEMPLFVVEDYPGNALMDPAAKGTAPFHVAVFPAMPGKEDAYRAFGFPESVYVGPPPHWETDKNAYEQARGLRRNGGVRKVRDGDERTITAEDAVIYVPGAKTIETEAALLRQLLEQFHDRLDRTVFHYRPHPGEAGSEKWRGKREEYDALLASIRGELGDAWTIANDELRSPAEQALRDTADARSHGVADVSVTGPGATAINWLGLLGHNTVVSMDLVMRGESLSAYEDSPGVRGLGAVARNLGQVRDAVRGLLHDPAVREALRIRQQAYAGSETCSIDWNTAPKILEAIQKRTKNNHSH